MLNFKYPPFPFPEIIIVTRSPLCCLLFEVILSFEECGRRRIANILLCLSTSNEKDPMSGPYVAWVIKQGN